MMIEDFSKFIGGNIRVSSLRSVQKDVEISDPQDLHAKFKFLKDNGLTFGRIPYYWDGYLAHPDTFLQEVDQVAKIASDYGMKLVWSFFHYHTSRYFDTGASGFPASIMSQYATGGDWKDSSIPFWKHLLDNYPVGCVPIWDAIADIQDIIRKKIDGYQSTWGYEILNEPQFPGKDEPTHKKYGDANTYIGQRMRARTQKYIVWNKGYGLTGGAKVDKFEYLTAPRTEKIVYDNHRYQIVGLLEDVKRVTSFVQELQNKGYDVRGAFHGEWAIGETHFGGSPVTEDALRTFMQAFHQARAGWTWWIFFSGSPGEGRVPFLGPDASGKITLTQVGQWFMKHKKLLYGI